VSGTVFARPRQLTRRPVRPRRYRLAVLNSHPIQYFAPLYRRLAQEEEIELTVYYCSRVGVEDYEDPGGFGQAIKWDVPLLEGYEYRFLPNLGRRHDVSRFESLINPGIVRELLRNRYDALWLHSYSYITHLLAVFASRLAGTPILYRTESSLTFDSLVRRSLAVRAVKPIFLRVLFRQVAAFLAIGTLNRQFFEHYGAQPERIFHVPYAIDNERFRGLAQEARRRRAQLRAELGFREDDVVFLFAARMTTPKAPIELLRAYEKVRSPRKGLIMAGDGELRSEAEAYVRERGLEGVRFPGFVNQSALPQVYAVSDVFVRPDGIAKGDWGLTVNEAMASGLALVSSDSIGATVDLVRHGENGFVWRFGDLEDLAGAMETLAADADACRRMGERSQEIISVWSYEECVRGILAALNSLPDSRNRP
jgi:glycosyltransferase involved in cell wall biosynthesis